MTDFVFERKFTTVFKTRVVIARESDLGIEKLVEINKKLGHTVHFDEKEGEFYVEIGGETIWRSPTAKFQHMPSGTYTFDSDGVLRYRGE